MSVFSDMGSQAPRISFRKFADYFEQSAILNLEKKNMARFPREPGHVFSAQAAKQQAHKSAQ
jgi:hypothetical protein